VNLLNRDKPTEMEEDQSLLIEEITDVHLHGFN
jgi:hypothetical protein